jgi:hypothetical protein
MSGFHFDRATEMLAKIEQQIENGSLTGAALDMALQMARMHTDLAQVEAKDEANSKAGSIRRHPSGTKLRALDGGER